MLILDSTKRLSVCQDYIAWIHFQEKRFTAIFKPTVCKPGLGCSEVGKECPDFDFYGNSLFFYVVLCLCESTGLPLPALLGNDLPYFKLPFLLVLRPSCMQACVCVRARMCVYKYTYGKTEARKSQRKWAQGWGTRTLLYPLPPFLWPLLVVTLAQSLPSFSIRVLCYFYWQDFQYFKLQLLIICNLYI